MFNTSFFVRRVKRHAAGKLLLDCWPGYEPLLDGKVRRLPGKIREMLTLWTSNPTLRRESDESYAAYEGGDFIDVGAFHGWYSWLLAPKARTGDRFVSCEPDERILQDLFANLATFARIFPKIPPSVISQPIGSGGSLTISHPGGGHPQYGSGGAASADAARTLTLDALAETFGLRPAFVKIDVEGAEMGVLQGMERILAADHPAIMLEIHPPWLPPGVSVDSVREALLRHGYRPGEADVSTVSLRQVWR